MSLIRSIRIINKELIFLPERKLLFEDLVKRKLAYRIIWKIFELARKCRIAHFLTFSYLIFSSLRIGLASGKIGEKNILSFSLYPAEKKEVSFIKNILNECSHSEVSLDILNCFKANSIKFLLISLRYISVMGRALSILKKYAVKEHFVTNVRISQLLGMYFRFCSEVDDRFAGILVSSLLNPEPLALVAAASKKNIKTIYSSHAFMPDKNALNQALCDIMILESVKAKSSFSLLSSKEPNFIFKGIPGETSAIGLPDFSSPLVCGIFLSAPINVDGLLNLIKILLEMFSNLKILIRPHPTLMLSPNLSMLEKLSEKVAVSKNRSLIEDTKASSFVISGDSNVHLEVLKMGVTTVYCSSLDLIREDYYKFVFNQIVMPLPYPLISLDKCLNSFYDESWVPRFKEYDAAYGETEAARCERIQLAIVTALSNR